MIVAALRTTIVCTHCWLQSAGGGGGDGRPANAVSGIQVLTNFLPLLSFHIDASSPVSLSLTGQLFTIVMLFPQGKERGYFYKTF